MPESPCYRTFVAGTVATYTRKYSLEKISAFAYLSEDDQFTEVVFLVIFFQNSH